MLLETEVLYCKEMEAESCKEMEAGCCCMDVVGWHLYCKEMEAESCKEMEAGCCMDVVGCHLYCKEMEAGCCMDVVGCHLEMEAESCKEMEAGCCMDVVGCHLYCREMEEHCVMLGLLGVHQVLQMLALCEIPCWNKTHTYTQVSNTSGTAANALLSDGSSCTSCRGKWCPHSLR